MFISVHKLHVHAWIDSDRDIASTNNIIKTFLWQLVVSEIDNSILYQYLCCLDVNGLKCQIL